MLHSGQGAVYPAPQVPHKGKACRKAFPVKDFQHVEAVCGNVLHHMREEAFMLLSHGRERQMPADNIRQIPVYHDCLAQQRRLQQVGLMVTHKMPKVQTQAVCAQGLRLSDRSGEALPYCTLCFRAAQDRRRQPSGKQGVPA